MQHKNKHEITSGGLTRTRLRSRNTSIKKHNRQYSSDTYNRMTTLWSVRPAKHYHQLSLNQAHHLMALSPRSRVLKRWANLFTTNCAHDIRVSVDTDFWDADVAVMVERHKLCRATADSGHVFSRRSHTPPLPPSLPPLWLPSHNRKPISKTGVLKYGLFPHALWCMGKRKSWLACDGPTIILCLI